MNDLNTILIVDDDQTFADSLRDVLKEWHGGWTISIADTPEKAIKYIQSNPVDAVVTDWKLDEHDKKVRPEPIIQAARAKDPLCIILVISGYTDEIKEKYDGSQETTPDDYIHKAEKGSQLAKELSFKLHMLLDRRNGQREAFTYARHIDGKLKLKYGNRLNKTELKKRWMTTVFTDIRGFSRVANELKAHPEVLATFLQALYQTIVECVHAHDGIVDKFMGDGSMLLFGILGPDRGISDKSHAISAVKSALMLRDRWTPLYEKFKTSARLAGVAANILSALNIGIGIHTDQVLVGIVTTEKRDQFTALGDGVNMAKRFESYASTPIKKGQKYGTILISNTVQSRVEEAFDLEQMPNVNLKNIGEKECWSVK